MSCCLTIKGVYYSTDNITADMFGPQVNVFKKGEKMSNGKVQEVSGISIPIGDSNLDCLETEIVDAIQFMKHHKVTISRLIKRSGVDDAYISFAIKQRNELALFDYFPAELLVLAGSIGLGIQFCQFKCANVQSKQ